MSLLTILTENIRIKTLKWINKMKSLPNYQTLPKTGLDVSVWVNSLVVFNSWFAAAFHLVSSQNTQTGHFTWFVDHLSHTMPLHARHLGKYSSPSRDNGLSVCISGVFYCLRLVFEAKMFPALKAAGADVPQPPVNDAKLTMPQTCTPRRSCYPRVDDRINTNNVAASGHS